MPILAIDIGNTRTKLAICEASEDGGLPRCVNFNAGDNADVEAIRRSISGLMPNAERVVVAASNKTLRDKLLSDLSDDSTRLLVIDSHAQIPIKLVGVDPRTVGLDRLLNALAVGQNTAHQSIVVDAGTATTVDLVADGRFAGGSILPGLRLSAQSLHDYTSALPRIETAGLNIDQLEVPGKNTRDAIATGVLFGQVGAIKEVIARLSANQTISSLVFTGGAAPSLLPAFPEAISQPHLTLQALASLA